MSLFIRSATPLSQTEILNQLRQLRSRAMTPYSNYHVAAIVEIKLHDNLYFYTSGVNIENDEHNRLSMHSEQNAIANAITLLGGHTKFSKIWIMAAAADTIPDKAQIAGKPCGHCRQILMSLAMVNAEIYSVTLDGRFSSPDSFEKHFLPESFSERDLDLSPSSGELNLDMNKFQAWEIINEARHLTKDEIAKYFSILSPHIISENFQTSPILACIVKCNNGRYAAGVLVQDIAFLTTDAIFAAIGNAVTQFGAKNLVFSEIHLASNHLHPAQLTLAEIEALSRRYVNNKTNVQFYTPDNQHVSYSFVACKHARNEMVDRLLEEKR